MPFNLIDNMNTSKKFYSAKGLGLKFKLYFFTSSQYDTLPSEFRSEFEPLPRGPQTLLFAVILNLALRKSKSVSSEITNEVEMSVENEESEKMEIEGRRKS